MLYLSLDHPAISCHDVNRQIEWYCTNLGMRLIASDGKTPPSALVGYGKDATDGAMLELMPVRDPGPEPATAPRFQPGLRHVAFRVRNFDEAYKGLKVAGVKFVFEPIDGAVGGGKIVSFRDPEGNELQIVERSEKSE